MSDRQEASSSRIFGRWQYATPLAVLVLGVALSAALFATLRYQQQRDIHGDFEQISRDHISVLKSIF